ncbi:MAG: protein serine/threonine phosphatase [Bacteroidetes bacterium]|nr:MAG: protein serine/threonine phosphatase [Bacteroidota bacterium]
MRIAATRRYFFSFLFFLPFFFSSLLHAGDNRLDSLLQLEKSIRLDSSGVSLLGKIADTYYKKNQYDNALGYARKMEALAKKLADTRGLAQAYGRMGRTYDDLKKDSLCVQHLRKALHVFRELKDSSEIHGAELDFGNFYSVRGYCEEALTHYYTGLDYQCSKVPPAQQARLYNNLGQGHQRLDQLTEALEAHQKALQIREKQNLRPEVASSMLNLGIIYRKLKEWNTALGYFRKARILYNEQGNKKGEINALTNIGNSFMFLSRYDSAAMYLRQAYATAVSAELPGLQVSALNSLGGVFASMYKPGVETQANENLLDSAIRYYRDGLVRCGLGTDSSDAISPLINLGSVLQEKKEFRAEAESMLLRAKTLAEKFHRVQNQVEVLKGLSDLYDKMNRPADALIYFRKYVQLNDSLNSDDRNRAIARLEATAAFEKKTETMKIKDAADKALADARSAQQRLVIWLVSGGLLLVLVSLVLLFNRFRITRKQKQIIEKQKGQVESQKELIEQKNGEILGSIHYAKRIQTALLASGSLISRHLPGHFIFYLPKDIVSGDFYWAYAEPSGRFLLLCGDSTGHGVPGAFMSLLNITKLNETTYEKKITRPAEILNHVREEIVKVLNPEENESAEVKDGMDCSLCAFDPLNRTVEYAGANNPLWLVRNGELLEFAPDKMPIGWSQHKNGFTSHTIPVQPGDMLYLFTDGFADQFGGAGGKKFKYSRLRENLIKCAADPAPVQQEHLARIFAGWKGDLEQVDDVLVIGVRIA